MGIPVKETPHDSIEYLAYDVVKDIETREVNDRHRLAYHIYLYLTREYPSLEEAVWVAQARFVQPQHVVSELIANRLRERGFTV